MESPGTEAAVTVRAAYRSYKRSVWPTPAERRLDILPDVRVERFLLAGVAQTGLRIGRDGPGGTLAPKAHVFSSWPSNVSWGRFWASRSTIDRVYLPLLCALGSFGLGSQFAGSRSGLLLAVDPLEELLLLLPVPWRHCLIGQIHGLSSALG